MEKLSSSEISNALSNIEGWIQDINSIVKDFTLKDFSSAIAFIVKIGIESEKMDHHPDLTLSSWNQVKVTLSTHSANGITENDIELAKIINNLL